MIELEARRSKGGALRAEAPALSRSALVWALALKRPAKKGTRGVDFFRGWTLEHRFVFGFPLRPPNVFQGWVPLGFPLI